MRLGGQSINGHSGPPPTSFHASITPTPQLTHLVLGQARGEEGGRGSVHETVPLRWLLLLLLLLLLRPHHRLSLLGLLVEGPAAGADGSGARSRAGGEGAGVEDGAQHLSWGRWLDGWMDDLVDDASCLVAPLRSHASRARTHLAEAVADVAHARPLGVALQHVPVVL